jgi:uncharacterized protein YdaU (DUF1376 family)
MNHYRHHIGDYRKDTGHLSLLEHGIYRQALDLYYLEEQPLPLEMDRLMRLLCVRNADEERSLCAVLADFFKETEEGYVHVRCERELEAFYEKSEKARESARKRWDEKKQPVTRKQKAADANAMRTHSERNANGMLPNYPSTQLPSSKNICRFAEFWQAYPRKKGSKQKAETSWKRQNLDSIADQVLQDVRTRTEVEWRDRQFIPYPTTYLNERRWETDIEDNRNEVSTRSGGSRAGQFAERVRRYADDAEEVGGGTVPETSIDLRPPLDGEFRRH